MAAFDKNPNSPNDMGMTPIYAAARICDANVIKVLAPLVDNPNAGIENATPIKVAEKNGHHIVQISFLSLTVRPAYFQLG